MPIQLEITTEKTERATSLIIDLDNDTVTAAYQTGTIKTVSFDPNETMVTDVITYFESLLEA